MYGIATKIKIEDEPIAQAPTLDQINYEVGVEAGANTKAPQITRVEPPLKSQEDTPGTNIKNEAEDETDTDIPKRFFGWVLLTVLSAIVLASNEKWFDMKEDVWYRRLGDPIDLISTSNDTDFSKSNDTDSSMSNDTDDMDSDERWISGGTSLVMIISFFSVAAHFVIKKYYVTKVIEGVVALLCLALWSAVLPVLMDNENTIGQDSQFVSVANPYFAHLYFSAWGALLTCLYLCSSYIHEVRSKINEDYSGMTRNTIFWYILLLASFVLMWSASVAYHDLNDALKYLGGCSDAPGDFKEGCRRTAFAVFVGVFGFLLTLPAVVLSESDKFPKMVEMGGVCICFILYCVGLGVITFENGPGQFVNNLYFATVSAFLILLYWTTDYVNTMWFGVSSNGGCCST